MPFAPPRNPLTLWQEFGPAATSRFAILSILLSCATRPCLCLVTSSQQSPVRPNILFFVADQHRFDAIGKGAHTPNLDKLAAQGVKFTKHYSSTPTCTPARAALLSGKSPWRHGLLSQGDIPSMYWFEFPREMAKHGYNTQLVGKGHYALQKHGFNKTIVYDAVRTEKDDYDTWFHEQPETNGQDQPNWDALNSWMPVTFPYPEKLHPTSWTGGMAINAVRRLAPDARAGKPFLLKVSFHRPHSPYDPLERHLDLLRGWPLREREPARASDGWDEVFRHCSPSDDRVCGEVDKDAEDKMRIAYLASIAFVDEQIGRVCEEVYAQGLWNNTFVLYTSDHGDQQSDHFLFRKSVPYEGSTHIPLILRWPETIAHRMTSDRGTWMSKPTELRDIFPTFLHVAGRWSPEYEQVLDGRPLTWLLEGKTESWRSWIDLEHGAWLLPPWSALTDGRMKFIYWPRPGELLCGSDNIKAPSEFQLFNLENDPTESFDLAKEPNMSSELQLWKQRLVEQYTREKRGEYWLLADGTLAGRGDCRYSPNIPGGAPTPCSGHWAGGLALYSTIYSKELTCSRLQDRQEDPSHRSRDGEELASSQVMVSPF